MKNVRSGSQCSKRVITDKPLIYSKGQPLVLVDGFVITDGGHNVTTHYVDISGTPPCEPQNTILKACEARYALEYSPTIRISSLERFRDFGEVMIEDDQEGHAYHREEQFSVDETYSAKNRELERSLGLLGQKAEFNDKKTQTNDSTESVNYGREWWIFSTSICPLQNEFQEWRSSLSPNYDHVSTIRQPAKFAMALGMMLADQKGPQGKEAITKHNSSIAGEFQTTHKTQLVIHGPVWYTEDVLSFLNSRQSTDAFGYYSIFTKDKKYESQREYRFAVFSETPVTEEWIDLQISGMMRDSLAPSIIVSQSRFSGMKLTDMVREGGSVGQKDPHTQSRSSRSRRNRKFTERWTTRYLDGDGHVDMEEHHVRERELVITEESVDVLSSKTDVFASEGENSAVEREREHHETVVDGEVVSEENKERMRIGVLERSENGKSERIRPLEEDGSTSEIEEANQLFDAIKNPSQPVKVSGGARTIDHIEQEKEQVFDVLTVLTAKMGGLTEDQKINVASAAWHSMWAIWNLHSQFGQIVDSVNLERGEFVAIQLKEIGESKSTGKILVGPRGTYAYVLSQEARKLFGHGGRKSGLVLFPDEGSLDDFAQFGWQTTSSDEEAD